MDPPLGGGVELLEVLGAPGVIDRVRALGLGAPQYPLPGPDRAELLAAIA